MSVSSAGSASADTARAAREEASKAAKRAELEARIRAKVTCEKGAYELQWMLLEGAVDEGVLAVSAKVLQPQHYEDVETERALDGQCGNVRCANPLPDKRRAPRYQISVSQRKVYDVQGLHRFCGVDCARASREFAATLSQTSASLRVGAEAVTQLMASLDASLSSPPDEGGAADGHAAAAAAPAVSATQTQGGVVERCSLPLAPPVPASSARVNQHQGRILGIVERGSQPLAPPSAAAAMLAHAEADSIDGYAPVSGASHHALPPRSVRDATAV